jgi:hypothetical protein
VTVPVGFARRLSHAYEIALGTVGRTGSVRPLELARRYSFRSRHPGGLQFAYANGSVHFIADAIALQTYRALASIKGGEGISAD